MGYIMKVTGEVIDEVCNNKDNGSYHISSGNKEYEIISKGKQALKDYLLIRKGQQVIVEGNQKDNTIHTEKSKIIIERGK